MSRCGSELANRVARHTLRFCTAKRLRPLDARRCSMRIDRTSLAHRESEALRKGRRYLRNSPSCTNVVVADQLRKAAKTRGNLRHVIGIHHSISPLRRQMQLIYPRMTGAIPWLASGRRIAALDELYVDQQFACLPRLPAAK